MRRAGLSQICDNNEISMLTSSFRLHGCWNCARICYSRTEPASFADPRACCNPDTMCVCACGGDQMTTAPSLILPSV